MLQVRFAGKNDADHIVRLIRSSFNSDILDIMIYGCTNINCFVKEQLSIPSEINDTIYIVAEKKNEIIGCIEFRKINELIILNYICTSQEYRNKGIGKFMLKEALLLVKKSLHKKIGLDVFCDNRIAKNWYEKLGFLIEYLTGWWRIPLFPLRENKSGYISGFAQSKICHEKFGFSQFTLTTIKNLYTIGILGDKWYRVTNPTILDDNDALSCLYELDSKRSIIGLFLDDGKIKKSEDAVLLCRSARLSTDLSSLLNNISA